jgi:hypothetical protein
MKKDDIKLFVKDRFSLNFLLAIAFERTKIPYLIYGFQFVITFFQIKIFRFILGM